MHAGNEKKKTFTLFLNCLLAFYEMLYPTTKSNFRRKKKKSLVIYSVILTAGLVGCLANAEMYGGGDTSDMWMNKEGLGRLLLKYLK